MSVKNTQGVSIKTHHNDIVHHSFTNRSHRSVPDEHIWPSPNLLRPRAQPGRAFPESDTETHPAHAPAVKPLGQQAKSKIRVAKSQRNFDLAPRELEEIGSWPPPCKPNIVTLILVHPVAL
eukprot:2772093-Pyramimonas_sp.AAC.1